MNKIHIEHVNEDFYVLNLPSGFTVYLYPKSDFSKKAAFLQVDFGSIHKDYALSSGNGRFHEGIAHFLEHMLFENTTVDIPKQFSSLGSSVNAYTTTNKTVYYYSTAEDFYEPLKLLLNVVFDASFDDLQVEKERAIILSEIDMYEDELEQGLYYDLMKSLYKSNPIRDDIAGTKEEVSQITKEELLQAYQLFYRPENAFLSLSGDFEIEEILKIFENHPFFNQKSTREIPEKCFQIEPAEPVKHHLSLSKDMHHPLLMIGSKLDIPEVSLKELAFIEFKYLLLFDNYFSKSSENTSVLLKKKRINQTFDFSVTLEPSYGHVILFSETKQPEKLEHDLKAMIHDMKHQDLDESRLQVQKQKLVGQFIQLFNSPQDAAFFMAEYHQKGISIDMLLETILHFTKEEINALKTHIVCQHFATVVYHQE